MAAEAHSWTAASWRGVWWQTFWASSPYGAYGSMSGGGCGQRRRRRRRWMAKRRVEEAKTVSRECGAAPVLVAVLVVLAHGREGPARASRRWKFGDVFGVSGVVRRQHRSIEARRIGRALTLPTSGPSMNSTVRLLALVARR
eukprot:5121960-Prymnesium_polylepis.1